MASVEVLTVSDSLSFSLSAFPESGIEVSCAFPKLTSGMTMLRASELIQRIDMQSINLFIPGMQK